MTPYHKKLNEIIYGPIYKKYANNVLYKKNSKNILELILNQHDLRDLLCMFITECLIRYNTPDQVVAMTQTDICKLLYVYLQGFSANFVKKKIQTDSRYNKFIFDLSEDDETPEEDKLFIDVDKIHKLLEFVESMNIVKVVIYKRILNECLLGNKTMKQLAKDLDTDYAFILTHKRELIDILRGLLIENDLNNP
jgi:hypothetical protein